MQVDAVDSDGRAGLHWAVACRWQPWLRSNRDISLQGTDNIAVVHQKGRRLGQARQVGLVYPRYRKCSPGHSVPSQGAAPLHYAASLAGGGVLVTDLLQVLMT